LPTFPEKGILFEHDRPFPRTPEGRPFSSSKVSRSRHRARTRGGFFVGSKEGNMPPIKGMPRGWYRPRKYKETVALRVCDLIREGLGWREIAMRPGMPRLGTLGRWYTDNAEFRALHDRAREAQAVVYRDDVGMLAHALSEPETRIKLRMDGRKWQVAEHHKTTAGKGERDYAAFDAEFIARLEAGLPRALRPGAGRGGDDDADAGPEPVEPESPRRASEDA
jgi:hypothetical protein